jgi:hypothetical protein
MAAPPRDKIQFGFHSCRGGCVGGSCLWDHLGFSREASALSKAGAIILKLLFGIQAELRVSLHSVLIPSHAI